MYSHFGPILRVPRLRANAGVAWVWDGDGSLVEPRLDTPRARDFVNAQNARTLASLGDPRSGCLAYFLSWALAPECSILTVMWSRG